MTVLRLFNGIFTIGPHLAGGREEYFADPSTVTWAAKTAIYGAQILILDAVLVSWHLYHGNL